MARKDLLRLGANVSDQLRTLRNDTPGGLSVVRKLSAESTWTRGHATRIASSKDSPVISSSGLTGSLDLSVTMPGFEQPVKRRFDSSPTALRRRTGRPLFVRRRISTGRAMELICVSNPRSVPACFVSRYSNSTLRIESSSSAAISSLFRLSNPERKQFLRTQSSISSAQFSLLLQQ